MNNNDAYSVWIRWRNRYRLYVSIALAILAVINAVFRFWGDWVYFYTALIGHFLFWQSIVAYLYDRDMNLGGCGANYGDGFVVRVIAIVISIIGYSLMFLFNGYPWK